MKKFITTFVLAVSFAFLTVAPGQAAVAVGEQAPDFTAQDTHGGEHSLSAYKGKFIVLEWINHQCPFVKKHYNSGNM